MTEATRLVCVASCIWFFGWLESAHGWAGVGWGLAGFSVVTGALYFVWWLKDPEHVRELWLGPRRR